MEPQTGLIDGPTEKRKKNDRGRFFPQSSFPILLATSCRVYRGSAKSAAAPPPRLPQPADSAPPASAYGAPASHHHLARNQRRWCRRQEEEQDGDGDGAGSGCGGGRAQRAGAGRLVELPGGQVPGVRVEEGGGEHEAEAAAPDPCMEDATSL